MQEQKEKNMDFIVDIIIPKNDIEKVNVVEELIEWGGEKLSQDPPKYSYKSILIFHENEDSYYQRVLEGFDTKKNIILTLEGQQLSELEFLINKQEQDLAENELLMFFNELYDRLDSFYITSYYSRLI